MLQKYFSLAPRVSPVVESPVRPFPWLPFSVKLLRETFVPRGGAGGPGSFGQPASGAVTPQQDTDINNNLTDASTYMPAPAGTVTCTAVVSVRR